MYKVFFNNNTIFFIADLQSLNLPKNTLVIDYKQDFPVNLLAKKASCEERTINYAVLTKDVERVFEEFKSGYKFIEAAGGVIYNTKNELLGIYRKNKWDLPKGKVNKKEGFEEAAIRECQEETGLISLRIERKIGETYHTYFQKQQVLKRTHWYKMNLLNEEPVTPQTEEDISAIEWFRNDKMEQFTNNTFASILDVLQF